MQIQEVDLRDIAESGGPESYLWDEAVASVVGREAVFTTYEGEQIVGIVSEPTKWSGQYPVIRFPDGKWGRADDVVQLVVAA